MQLSLFDHVEQAFAESSGELTNQQLYAAVAKSANIDPGTLNAGVPIGSSGERHSPIKRQIRWHQQTLKAAGLIRRSKKRGRWELTGKGKIKLRKIQPKSSLVAFSTSLGAAVWSLSDDVFSSLDAPITLCVTSPPYPLKSARAYGNPSVDEYIEFIIESLRPIVRNLEQGGSICLNVSNDIFEPGSPARSIYREQLVIAMVKELGLWKMDELIWDNPCKPPSPIRYASMSRQQLNATYEPIYWFSNNPSMVKADNRRVLQPHSESQLKLIGKGGEQRARSNSDDAYRVRKGSYGNQTAGKIPRNILRMPHNCPSQSAYKKVARDLGLPPHGAPYPLALATFLIRFLSEPNDLVVDPFGGSLTTGVAAEQELRRWLISECMWEYIRAGGERWRDSRDLIWTPEFLSAA